MKLFIFLGVAFGFLLGTLFGLSAVAHQLFVTGTWSFSHDEAGVSDENTGAPYVVEELEFVEGVPVPPGPQEDVPPADNELMIQEGD